MWIRAVKDLRGALMAPAPQCLEQRAGFTNGAEVWASFHFNDVAVESVSEDKQGTVVLVLSSPEPRPQNAVCRNIKAASRAR
jgi:hypothetical protein